MNTLFRRSLFAVLLAVGSVFPSLQTFAATGTTNDPVHVIVDSGGAGGGGGTQYAEDAAAASGDTGTMALCIRANTAAATAANGDYTPCLTDALGKLWTTGSFAEDSAHTDGDFGQFILAVRRDANTSLVGTDGDLAPLQVDATGNLKAAIITALPAGTNGIGKLTSNAGVTIGAVELAAAQTLATVTTVSTVSSVTAIANALPAGTNAIGKLAANSGVDIGDVDVTSVIPGVGATNEGKAEDAAHSSGDTGVMMLAVRRDANTALATTDGDYAPPQVSALGAMKVAVTEGGAAAGTATAPSTDVLTTQPTRANAWSYAAASGGITNTTAATIKTAAGGSVKNCVGSMQIVNGHATVSTEVLLKDGAGGTVLHRFFAQAAGGGWAGKFDNPICGTANTLLEVVPVTTGSAIYVNAQGFTGN